MKRLVGSLPGAYVLLAVGNKRAEPRLQCDAMRCDALTSAGADV
jgi:hypothetical protein